MVPGLGFIGRRLGGGKKTRADATAQSDVPEGMIMLGDEKGFAREPQGAHDSVHSLHTMEKEAPSVRAKPSPPPSPTSTLPDVAFLDLNGTDSKSSEASISGPDDEPTLTADDREWQWHEPASEVDPKDAATPDRWVKRNRHLIRLTGRHPLNCEPPMPMLMEKGFITPVSLHYVRNHGAVPKLDWDSHRVHVTGMVDNPMTFSVSELISLLPSYTIPVTLVCAGNRRKEQNIVKKSVGFNWGPTAVSTTYWTGVRLCDLLKHCGAKTPLEGARYVHFRGVQKELPQGADGSYGTSLAYATACDPACDVMLAYKQNGRTLAPDHGFPIRMIIPGHIGGRMVKWLEEICVAPEESQNFYHFHDNRVLPPGVDQEKAKAEGWWYRPEFIINELNINAAISTPSHDEIVPLTMQPYTVRGYAYSGGGRKVIRCELSLDGGDTWRLADIQRHENATPYNKFWCWVFWSVEVPAVDLLRSTEIRVRAVDSSNNLMPEKLTWNLMGMMNNPHYRVKVHVDTTSSGQMAMRFEHPTKSGSEAGGWMEREMGHHVAQSLPTESDTGMSAKKLMDEGALPAFTLEQVEEHASRESSWFVYEGKVYDATKFLQDHPGGPESILIVAGQDASDEFNAIHSAKAKGMLKDYLIGRVGESAAKEAKLPLIKELEEEKAGTADLTNLVALNPKKKIPFELVEKIELSHNTRLFRFALQSPRHRLGLPIGQHMFFYAKEKGELVMRAYTPTSSDDDLGHFDLVVKVYFGGQHKDFPEGGRMSQYLEKMKLGDKIDVKGPLGHFVYEGKGRFRNSGQPGTARTMSMIAGGTGITPMFQIIKAILKDKEDRTRVRLIFANQAEGDILLRPELDAFAKDERLEIHYVLSRPTNAAAWTCGSTGRVCEEMLRKHLFPPGTDSLALMCGPPGMQDASMVHLEKWGYTKDKVIIF
ncbi:hypothetical protein WJX75_006549 [Coccomyxa subellipsoidea]|uniref:Nitrate reductase n=1 Tax=Coccomyxa subellipsoidea TaxID=248742 RepID=A0ABR2YE34_9CHLO